MQTIIFLYLIVFIRALATGMIGVLLGIYLVQIKLSVIEMGWVMSAGLLGSTLVTLLVTFKGEMLGRKHWLMLISLLSALGGMMLAQFTEPLFLGAAAFLGMINGMGRDRGAALVLEQALLPSLVDDQKRTLVFAWYNVLQDVGHACGGILAAMPTLLRYLDITEENSFRLTMIGYALLMSCGLFFYPFLSSTVEVSHPQQRLILSAQSRRILARISALFALDSLAGGFVGTALLAFYFYQRFEVSEMTVGLLFLGARIANAFSHLGAAWLAKRIGLVKTMVLTHIPSSLLLMTVTIAPNFWVAALLFLCREGFVEMDVPTRQSYVMAVVQPQERTFASGLTHLVRLSGWSLAPVLGGWLMYFFDPAIPLLIGAGMKIIYDILLYISFRSLQPPEEKKVEVP